MRPALRFLESPSPASQSLGLGTLKMRELQGPKSFSVALKGGVVIAGLKVHLAQACWRRRDTLPSL